jgi:hypothetical protein
MPQLPICILRDLTMPVLLYSPHNYAAPTGLPAVPAASMLAAPASALDTPMPMLHPPGNMTGKNKYTTTVLHQGLGVIQASHDLGMMLPHVQLAPAVPNFFTPLHIMFSSRKVMFSSSTVKVDKQFVGFAGVVGLPPTPMLVCAEPIGYPMGEVPTRWLNSVWVGFTWLDWALGAMAIGVSLLVDRAFAPKTREKAIEKVKKAAADGLKKQVVKKLFPQDKGEWIKFGAKQGAAMAVGVVTAAGKGGDSESGITLGSDYASVGLKVKRDASHNLSVSVSGKVLAVSKTVGVEEGKGVFSKSDANWGGGVAGHEGSPKGEQIPTHNAFDGTATSQPSK